MACLKDDSCTNIKEKGCKTQFSEDSLDYFKCMSTTENLKRRALSEGASADAYKKAYCDKKYEGESKDEIFHCYLENQVGFAQTERCDYFNADNPTDKLRCYIDNNVPKSVKYCDAIYALATNHNTKQDELEQCYKDAGFT